jgi:hypothetical protein
MSADLFAVEALKVGLRNMFNPTSHFNICLVEQGLKTMGVIAPPKELAALHLLHCVSWRDMEPEFREEVARRTLALFAHPDFTVDVVFEKPKPKPQHVTETITAVVVTHPQPRPSLMRRLLSSN